MEITPHLTAKRSCRVERRNCRMIYSLEVKKLAWMLTYNNSSVWDSFLESLDFQEKVSLLCRYKNRHSKQFDFQYKRSKCLYLWFCVWNARFSVISIDNCQPRVVFNKIYTIINDQSTWLFKSLMHSQVGVMIAVWKTSRCS